MFRPDVNCCEQNGKGQAPLKSTGLTRAQCEANGKDGGCSPYARAKTKKAISRRLNRVLGGTLSLNACANDMHFWSRRMENIRAMYAATKPTINAGGTDNQRPMARQVSGLTRTV
jgi:hypothetical protein